MTIFIKVELEILILINLITSRLDCICKNLNKHLEIICFIPKCITNFNNYYDISINYIVQCYYRLKGRKNHETLDFEKCGKEKSLLIFLSFLSLFHYLLLEQ